MIRYTKYTHTHTHTYIYIEYLPIPTYIFRFVSSFINKIIVGCVSLVTALMNFKMFRDTHNIFIKGVYKCWNSFMSLCIDKCVLEWRLLEKPDTDRQRATERRLCFVPCSFFFFSFCFFLPVGSLSLVAGVSRLIYAGTSSGRSSTKCCGTYCRCCVWLVWFVSRI